MDMEYNNESNRVGIYTQTSVEATAIGAGLAPNGEKSPVATNPYMRQTNEYVYGENVANVPHFDIRSGNNFGNMGNASYFDQRGASSFGNMGNAPPFERRSGNNFGHMVNAPNFDQRSDNNFGHMGNAPHFQQRSGSNFGNIGNAPMFDQRSANNFENMGNVSIYDQRNDNNFGNMGIASHYDGHSYNKFENIGNVQPFGQRSGDEFGNQFDHRGSETLENRRNAPDATQPSFFNTLGNRQNAQYLNQRRSEDIESKSSAPQIDQRSCDSFESKGNGPHFDQRSCESFVSRGNTSSLLDQRSSDSFANSDNPFKKNIDFTRFQVDVGKGKKKSKKKKKNKVFLDPREWREKRERSRAIATEKNIPSSVKQYPLCEEFFGQERWKRALRTLRRIGYNSWEINAMFGNLDSMLREGKLEQVERPELPSDDEDDDPKWREPKPPQKKNKKKNKSQKQASGDPKLKASQPKKSRNDEDCRIPITENRVKRKLIKSEEVYEEPDLSAAVEEEVKDDLRVNIGDASHPDFHIPPQHRNDLIIKIHQLMAPEDKTVKIRDRYRAILNFLYINGKLLLVCKNKCTVEFIESILPELNTLWEGAKIVFCPRFGIRKKIQICIKDCDFSTEEVLTIISRQNAIDTNKWAVTKRFNEKSTAYLDVVIDVNAYLRFFIDQDDMFFFLTRVVLKVLSWYPYIVSLQDRLQLGNDTVLFRHFCGGSLISTTWIVTAGHCVYFKNKKRIVAAIGYENLKASNLEYQDIDSISLIDFVPLSLKNDIALVRLKRPFASGKQINFGLIPGFGVTPSEESPCTVIGYGAEVYGGQITEALKEAKVSIISRIKCTQILGKIMAPQEGDLSFCGLGDLQDSCQGDSGGPLICTVKNRSYIFGIVSHGLTCGQKGVPSVYTATAPYKSWIDRMTKDNK